MLILLWIICGLLAAAIVANFEKIYETKSISFNVFAGMFAAVLLGYISFFFLSIMFVIEWFSRRGEDTMFDWEEKDL